MSRLVRQCSIAMSALEDSRRGEGYANTWAFDRNGDVILPGAFKDALGDFVQNGAVLDSHDHSTRIGMVESAEEDDKGLRVAWRYYEGVPAAESAYQEAKQRLAAGKGVGLSIGFALDDDGYLGFKNGAQLLEWFKETKTPYPKGFDPEAARAWDRTCWVIKRVAALYEFSQVTVPANAQSGADLIKRFGGDGSLADLPLQEHLALALAVAEGLVARLGSAQALRELDGRQLSADRGEQALTLARRLDEIAAKAKPRANEFDTVKARLALFRAEI